MGALKSLVKPEAMRKTTKNQSPPYFLSKIRGAIGCLTFYGLTTRINYERFALVSTGNLFFSAPLHSAAFLRQDFPGAFQRGRHVPTDVVHPQPVNEARPRQREQWLRMRPAKDEVFFML